MSISDNFLSWLNAAASSLNERLDVYGLRFTPAQPVRRWHYMLRNTVRDSEAASFAIEVERLGEGVIAQCWFAVLAPNREDGECGAELLTCRAESQGLDVRHFSNLPDGSSVPIIIKSELVAVVQTELRAIIDSGNRAT